MTSCCSKTTPIANGRVVAAGKNVSPDRLLAATSLGLGSLSGYGNSPGELDFTVFMNQLP